MKMLLLVSCLLFTSLAKAQEWSISRIDQIEIDGYHKEWHDIPSIVFSSNNSAPGINLEDRHGKDNHINDLLVNLKFAWNENGLYAAIDWRDDTVDEKHLPKEMGRWEHPEGGARDRMYLYDNIALRLSRETDYYYGTWLAPREEQPSQWSTIRLGPRGTTSANKIGPELNGNRVEPGRILMEVFWSWEELEFRPNINEVLTIAVIIPDSDLPKTPLEIKERQVKFMHMRQVFRFR